MASQELKKMLSDLHHELEGSESSEIKQETLPLLRQLSDDLERLLDDEDETEENTTVLERMRDGLLKMEARHPQLTHAINRVSDALANLGI